MAIVGIQNVYLIAEEMDSALDFYQALGAKLRFRDGQRWAQMEVAGSKLAIASGDEGGPGATGATIVFESDELDADLAIVAEAGGSIVERRDMGNHGVTVLCRDKVGNLLQLFSRIT